MVAELEQITLAQSTDVPRGRGLLTEPVRAGSVRRLLHVPQPARAAGCGHVGRRLGLVTPWQRRSTSLGQTPLAREQVEQHEVARPPERRGATSTLRP